MLALVALVAVVAAPRSAAADGAGLEAARTFRLENGLTVVTIHDPSRPVAAVQMLYRAGARNETTGITGIAHYLEHMLFRGTASFGLRDVTGVIERAGGEWHGYTYLDCTTFFEAAPRDLLPTLLRLEAERMTSARLAADEVDPERGAVFEEYRGYQNEPRTELFDATLATLFLQHPYRNNTMGWESDLAGITHADLTSFYRRYYAPGNAVLAIAGDFDPGRIEAQVREAFGAIPAGGDSTAIRTVEPPLTGQRRIDLRQPGASPAIMLSFLAPPPARPADFAALMILGAVLGSARGLSFYHHSGDTTAGADVEPMSRLGRLLPGGPADRFGTSILPTLYPYAFSIYADPRPGRAPGEIEPLIFSALRGVAEGLDASEVEAARRRIEAADLLETDSLVEKAHEAAFWTGLGGAGARDAVLEALRGVGPDQVRALARGMTPDRAVVGTLLPVAGEDAAAGATAPAADAAPAGPAPIAAPPGPPAVSGPGPQRDRPDDRGARPLARSQRPAVETLDLPSGARAIVDARPGLFTFTLRLAVAPAADGAADEVARLRVAGSILATDADTRSALAAGGVRLTIEPPGGGRLAEADGLHVSIEGPAFALATAAGQIGPALRRALATRETIADFPSRDPERRAVQLLQRAIEAPARAGAVAGTIAGPPAKRGAGARVVVGVVSPFAPRSLRPILDDLARAAGASGRPTAASGRPGGGPDGHAAGVSGGGPGTVAVFPSGRRVETMEAIAQGRLLFAFPGDGDAEALRALTYILHHRYSGRLGVRAIAEMGLVYSMESEAITRGRPFAFVTMGAVPASLPRLEAALNEVLDRTAATLTGAEVAEYRSFAAGDVEVRLTDPEKAARLWCSALLRGEDATGPAAAVARARALTRDRVADLARTALDPARRLTILITSETTER